MTDLRRHSPPACIEEHVVLLYASSDQPPVEHNRGLEGLLVHAADTRYIPEVQDCACAQHVRACVCRWASALGASMRAALWALRGCSPPSGVARGSGNVVNHDQGFEYTHRPLPLGNDRRPVAEAVAPVNGIVDKQQAQ